MVVSPWQPMCLKILGCVFSCWISLRIENILNKCLRSVINFNYLLLWRLAWLQIPHLLLLAFLKGQQPWVILTLMRDDT